MRVELTRCRVDRFRLPFGIQEALHRLIITLRDQPCRLVLIRQFVPLDQRGNDAPDGIGSISEMLPDRLGDLVQEHARGIEDAETPDRGDVLRDNVLGLGTGMQKTLDISERVSGALSPNLGTRLRRFELVNQDGSLIDLEKAFLDRQSAGRSDATRTHFEVLERRHGVRIVHDDVEELVGPVSSARIHAVHRAMSHLMSKKHLQR